MNLFTFYLVELLSNNVKRLAHFPLKKRTLTYFYRCTKTSIEYFRFRYKRCFIVRKKKCRERYEVLCKLEVILTTRISTKYCVVYIGSILKETSLKFVLFYLHVTHKHNNTFLFMTYLMLFLVNVQILKHKSEYRTSSGFGFYNIGLTFGQLFRYPVSILLYIAFVNNVKYKQYVL